MHDIITILMSLFPEVAEIMKLISYLVLTLNHLLQLFFTKNAEVIKVRWSPKHDKVKPMSPISLFSDASRGNKMETWTGHGQIFQSYYDLTT